MLKFIIYEDNITCLEKAATAVHKAMASYDFEYKIGKYSAYSEKLNQELYDDTTKKIYILDIEVPEVSGLEIASRVREFDWKSVIIFVTSHPECQNDIFYSRLLALDYMSKYSNYDKRLEASIIQAVKILDKSRVLSYKYNYVSYRIDYDDILYIEKIPHNKKSIIYTENGNEIERVGSMLEILSLLDKSFCLSHKSCIVNLDKVQSVDLKENVIILKNGEVLKKLSYRHKKDFENRLLTYR